MQGLEFFLAPHKSLADDMGTGFTRCFLPQLFQDLHGIGPGGWIASQKGHAEPSQVLRNARCDDRRCRWIHLLFGLEHGHGRARIRKAARKGFVEHHAHCVPVAGFRGPPSTHLLWGNVRRRAHQLGRQALGPRILRCHILDQAEVEDHDPAFFSHQYVVGFKIPMEFARRVKGRHAIHQLAQGFSQTRCVLQRGGCPGFSRHQGKTIVRAHRRFFARDGLGRTFAEACAPPALHFDIRGAPCIRRDEATLAELSGPGGKGQAIHQLHGEEAAIAFTP